MHGQALINMCTYFVPLLLLQWFMASIAMTVTNVATDQSALLEFKAHMTFEPHNVLTYNWSTSTSICNWIGVSCSARHGRVTALNLPNLGLEGTIPPHLGNLSFLVSLNISVNSFHGHLPKELGKLRRLKIIDFSRNSLSGELPTWFGALYKLQHLNLSSNSFTGTMLRSLFNISKLMILDLQYNFFQGNIPYEIAKLPNLKVLRVGNNQLSGSIPAAIYNMSSLQTIDFKFNSLSGSLPDDMCNSLPQLEFLELASNKFFGQLPSSLGNCCKLQNLSLYENNFTGEIPQTIGNLTKLKKLSLGWNNLRGEIPHEVGNLHHLWLLHIAYNNLTGLIPSTIFNISTIEVIVLSVNHLSGCLPSSSIGLWAPNLKELSLRDNNLNGIIPSSISNASKLTLLSLSTNSFSGPIPHTLGYLKLLQYLGIDNNYLTIHPSTAELSFLSSLTNCRQLKLLVISSNPLNGILPTSIGNFSSTLQQIFAYNCKIKGSIPLEIGNLSNIIFIGLDDNDLTGFVPTTVGRLRMLQILSLRGNKLQGSIAYGLCCLDMLFALLLNGNNLSGHLPTCLANLTSLRHVDLHSNKLSSTMPSSFWSLTYILTIDLSSNYLHGSLSSDIQNLKVVSGLDFSKNQFSGNIPNAIGGLKDLAFLSLADNRFQGHIPQSFRGLVSMEDLDLSINNLSGVIPKSLEALLYLKYFNVSFNRLEGEIPSQGAFKNFSAQSFLPNYALCGSSRLQLPPCKSSKFRGSKVAKLKYILPAMASTMLALAFVLICIRCRKGNASLLAQENLLPLATWRRISYQELQRATNGFNECNLLGTGSFSSVYRGTLSDGMNMAVKVFNLQLEGAFRSFDVECEIMRNIRHRNLIRIISSCCNIDFKALVLEFVPNGSLEKWLYSHNYFLDNIQRMSIMIDVASALEYLHHGYDMPVVHCDLKPSNVLLDEDMVAHVGDFGITKFLGDGNSMTRTMTLATIGYMAPEYGLEGMVSVRGDVYSYGILLMETFTRKKPIDEIFTGDMNLKSWVNESLPHAVIEVVDANLIGREEEHFTAKKTCISSVLGLALNCCADLPEDRMNMKDVLATLKKIKTKFLKDVECVTRRNY